MASDLLRSINDLWLKRIRVAADYRKRAFEPVANKIDRYYHTRRAWMFMDDSSGASPEDMPFRTARQYHRISVAKTGEFVRIMLPYIFYQVPVRRVTPRARKVPDELMELLLAKKGIQYSGEPSAMLDRGRVQSYLAEFLLNYAADDATYNLRGESRKACQEALVAGRGILWHEAITTPNGVFPGSFFESWRNVLFDPDYEEIRLGQYIARRKRLPVWHIADIFQQPIEKIRANAKSFEQLALDDAGRQYFGDAEKDIGEYWEVYSRIGFGHRLCADPNSEEYKRLELISSQFDNHVFLAVMDGMEHPLNLDPDRIGVMTAADLAETVSWPIKFFGDFNDPWPCSVLDFYPDGIYPKPPLEDALPLQAFLDFAFYYLMGRIKETSRNIVLVDQAAAKKLKQALESGFDLEIVELAGKAPELASMVYQLKFDPVNTDLWTIITAVNNEWENSTGINALVRGGEGSSKFRSSADAQIHHANSQIRPDDLRDCVQAWQGAIARKEHIAQRLLMREDVAVYFGEDGYAPMLGPVTEAWMQYVATDDPWTAAQELAIMVEGAAGRRRDKETQLATLKEIAQILVPVYLQERAATGDPTQINAYLTELFDALDTPDPGRFLLREMPQQQGPQPMPEEEMPTEGEQATEMAPEEQIPPELMGAEQGGMSPEDIMMQVAQQEMGEVPPDINTMGM